MAVSYKKLFKLMIDRDIKRKDLKEMTGLSYATIAKLEKGENVQMDVLDRICTNLKSQLSDIADINYQKRGNKNGKSKKRSIYGRSIMEGGR